MTVNDKVKEVEGVKIRSVLKNQMGKLWLGAFEGKIKSVSKNAERPLEKTAKRGVAVVSRSHKEDSPTIPDLTTFYQSRNGLHLGKLVQRTEYYNVIPTRRLSGSRSKRPIAPPERLTVIHIASVIVYNKKMDISNVSN